MTKTAFPNSAKNLTDNLAARSRARRRALKGAVAVETVSAAPRRNDLLPELKLETRPLASLKPAKRRLRDIDPAHVADVAASIGRLGVSKPILIAPDGEIIDGHVEVEAARLHGLAEIPCIVVSHLSDEEVRLLRLALNRLGEKGTWSFDALKIEFAELIEIEAPLEITGFELAEVDIVLRDEPVIDAMANECPEPAKDLPPVTKLDDMWTLGRHRLICANALKPETYEPLFKDKPQARAVFADPPYNIPIQGFVTGQSQHRDFVMGVGELSDDEFVVFLSDSFTAASKHLVDGGIWFTCMDHRHDEHVRRAARAAGLSGVTLVVWYKGSGGMGRLYRSAHELIFVLKKGDGPVLNNIALGKHGRDRTNVWQYPGANRRGSSANEQLTEHATPKPVELVADALLDVTKRGDIVIDPFCGSGTTVIAAEKTGRTAFCAELDPHYCDVIIRRFEKFTGTQAVHAASGLTFAEMAALRERDAAAGKVAGAAPSGATDTVDSVATPPSAPHTTAESAEAPETPIEVQAPMAVAENS